MNTRLETVLEHVVDTLIHELGENLDSCCVYGSAVRGNYIVDVSDINLLILLKDSSVAAHESVARALHKFPKVDPFVLGRRGFERSVRAFAPKFASIQLHYRILHGNDPFSSITLDAKLEKFLCEQALRNLRLRLIFAYVTRHRNHMYANFILRNVTPIFIRLSEALRLSGKSHPDELGERIPLLVEHFGVDGAVLADLLKLKQARREFTDAELVAWHEKLFPLVDTALIWMEKNWTEH